MKLLKFIIFLVSTLCITGVFSTSNYQSVTPGYDWAFPKDHGAHPNFQTEWWYYTGHLTAKSGETFGFEITFFRNAEAQNKPASIWQSDQLYVAHFAITDDQARQFYHDSRTTRPAYNMAGASEGQLSVFNGDWSVKQLENTVYLKASMTNITLDLAMDIKKGPVFHGPKGYSKKVIVSIWRLTIILFLA